MKFFVVCHYPTGFDKDFGIFDTLQDAIDFCKDITEECCKRNKYPYLDSVMRIYSCDDKFVSVRYLDNKIFID